MNKWIWILLVAIVIALVASAFLFMDFKSVRSNLSSDSQTSSFRIGLERDQPPPPIATLALYAQEQGIFQQRFTKHIADKLSNITALNQVEIFSKAVDQDDNPMVIVEFDKVEISWTPIYGKASIEVSVAFASDGDVSFRHTTPVHFDDGDSPSLKIQADIQIRDETRGVISRMAYHEYLKESVSQAIVNLLMTELSP